MFFSKPLQDKVNLILKNQRNTKLGNLEFSSPLLLAPMSSICNYPYRYLMQQLGSGGSVSELISCHGINYQNDKTLKMLYINKNEKYVGIQLFGEDSNAMAESARVAETYGPQFIDLNLGCPVNKVVKKGGGSALLRDTAKLGTFFSTIKSAINIPLTIKIRTGWDEESINADEIINIAYNEGVEFVAVHGRTRAQQYKGLANWDYLEQIAKKSPLPVVGNGDLATSTAVKNRLETTNCPAVMIGRGALRHPFIFLESIDQTNTIFTPLDYLEVIEKYDQLLYEYTERERHHSIQLKKMSIWFLAGFPGISKIRNELYQSADLKTLKENISNYLYSLQEQNIFQKSIDENSPFMTGGHG